MPSKLPVIKANTTQENIDKMKVIAEKNKRSLAKELEFIIENHINDYEKEYGKIELPEKPEKKEDSTAKKIVKAVSGVTLGEALADKVVDKIHKKQETTN